MIDEHRPIPQGESVEATHGERPLLMGREHHTATLVMLSFRATKTVGPYVKATRIRGFASPPPFSGRVPAGCG
jgi:hypothetical protein